MIEFEDWLHVSGITADEHIKAMMLKAWEAGYNAALDAAISRITGRDMSSFIPKKEIVGD